MINESTKIVIEPYSSDWSKNFDQIKDVLKVALEGMFIDIKHVGSTSVPGMAAKPVLDIDIVVESFTLMSTIIRSMQTIGYRHMGTMGISGREVFIAESVEASFLEKTRSWMQHNIYVCDKFSQALKNHLKFREFLIDNPDAIVEYSVLKKKLASMPGCTLAKYSAAKTEFITGVLLKAGLTKEEVDLIKAENT